MLAQFGDTVSDTVPFYLVVPIPLCVPFVYIAPDISSYLLIPLLEKGTTCGGHTSPWSDKSL
jgi:Na+/H+ antiporter NhaC